jgi:hypothetical protein
VVCVFECVCDVGVVCVWCVCVCSCVSYPACKLRLLYGTALSDCTTFPTLSDKQQDIPKKRGFLCNFFY